MQALIVAISIVFLGLGLDGPTASIGTTGEEREEQKFMASISWDSNLRRWQVDGIGTVHFSDALRKIGCGRGYFDFSVLKGECWVLPGTPQTSICLDMNNPECTRLYLIYIGKRWCLYVAKSCDPEIKTLP